MMLGVEGQSHFQQRHLHAALRELKSAEFWDMVEDLFLKCRNVIVDRVKFFTRRQKPNESLELFHGVLSGLAAKCQQKFCKKLIDPDRVLALAIEYERGIEDQKSLSSCSLGLALPTIGSNPPTERRSLRPRRCALSNRMCTVESAPLVQLLPSPRAANCVATVVAPLIRDTRHLARQNQYSVATATRRATSHACAAVLLQRTPNNRLNLAARHLLGPRRTRSPIQSACATYTATVPTMTMKSSLKKIGMTQSSRKLPAPAPKKAKFWRAIPTPP